MSFQTMTVTSPPTRGPEVTRRQRVLDGRNAIDHDLLKGRVDGVFGPETGRACIRAKYWLGFPLKEQTATYGERLERYLTGKRKLPRTYQERRDQRLLDARKPPLATRAFAQALKDVGMKEHPAGSNRCPISERWGILGPWCAMAVSTWYLRAGSTAFKMHRDWAFVPFMLAAAHHGNQGLALTRAEHVVHGDVVTFDWDNDGVADHVGLFAEWIVRGASFRTIEGNTGVGNDSNGGEVMRRQRKVSDVALHGGQLGFIHVAR